MTELITLEHFHIKGRQFLIRMPDAATVPDRPHYHDYYQMLYVLSGEVRHEHDGRVLSLFAGDAFIIPPMFSHRLEIASQKTAFYSLAFSAGLFHAGFSQSNIYRFLTELSRGGNGEEDVHLRIRLSADQQEIFSVLMECLVKEQNTCPEGAYTAVPSLISSALYILAQSYSSERTAVEESGAVKAVRDCIRYIDRHYTEDISMNKLSREFAVSRSSLCSLFKDYTGLSIRKYIRNKRILKAETMLRTDPSLPLSDAAAAVGFSEPSTFFRNFTEVVGVSPSRYRAGFRSHQTE